MALPLLPRSNGSRSWDLSDAQGFETGRFGLGATVLPVAEPESRTGGEAVEGTATAVLATVGGGGGAASVGSSTGAGFRVCE
jgi:hypothetical protein